MSVEAAVSDFVATLGENAETKELGSGFSRGLAILSFVCYAISTRCSSRKGVETKVEVSTGGGSVG